MTLKTSAIKKHFLIRQKHNDNNFFMQFKAVKIHKPAHRRFGEGQLQPRLLPTWLKDSFMRSVDRH